MVTITIEENIDLKKSNFKNVTQMLHFFEAIKNSDQNYINSQEYKSDTSEKFSNMAELISDLKTHK